MSAFSPSMTQVNKEKLLQARVHELETEVTKLKKVKEYGLVFDDKPEDVVLQCRENVPVLREVKSKNITTDESLPTNLLIEGDNYHALTVLNYTHKGKIDVIYIDPPYNTGARDWKYNNNYVDSEDPYRHTKWLSFMRHRLSLTKNLLKDDGIICVTIDDYEMPRLWMLMEEIFGESNHLGTLTIRINPGGRKSKRKIAAQHEYALYFSKSPATEIAKIFFDPSDKTHSYKQDKEGNWYEERNLRKEGADSLAKEGAERFYPIYFDPKTGRLSTVKKYSVEILPIDTSGQKRIWRRDKSVIDEMSDRGEVFTKKTKYGLQVYFKFYGGLEGETPKSFWDNPLYSASEHGTQVLDKILGKREAFPFPKSPHAVRDCIRIASSKKDAVILDYFAGSGTTGQAVLELNKEDKGKRRFILCTNDENNICEEITYERVKRIIKGYKTNASDKFEGLGGNLGYYKTEFINVGRLHRISDEAKIKVTYEAGELIAIREDTLKELEKNEWWQIFEGRGKQTAIYFREDKSKLRSLVAQLEKKNIPTALYIFSWGKNEYKADYATEAIRVEDIPEPILAVYRELNTL
jgi:adenine-specific DNA-methyltransferase